MGSSENKSVFCRAPVGICTSQIVLFVIFGFCSSVGHSAEVLLYSITCPSPATLTNTRVDMGSMKVGILAFQGAFVEHEYSLQRAVRQLTTGTTDQPVKLEIRQVRTPQDIDGLHGLILPGGESTTMSKFLDRNRFKDTLDNWMAGRNGRRPIVWGTCAGLILLANNVKEMKLGGQLTLGGMDITADRNKYGRQNESFEATVHLSNDVINRDGPGSDAKYKGIFIRAPGIASLDNESVKVLAELEDSSGVKVPVAARQRNLIVTSFHPELTEDHRWHTYFLEKILKNMKL